MKNIREIICILKELKTGGKIMGLIVALLCIIIDCLLGFKQGVFFDLFRSLYVSILIFSIIFITNDFCIMIENRIKKREQRENIVKSLNALTGKPFEIMYHFAEYGCLSQELNNEDEINAALTLRHLFNFVKVDNKRVLIDSEYLELIEDTYFPLKKPSCDGV